MIEPAQRASCSCARSVRRIAAIDAPDAATLIFSSKAVDAWFIAILASPFELRLPRRRTSSRSGIVPRYRVDGLFQYYQLAWHMRQLAFDAKRFDGYFREVMPYIDSYKACWVESGPIMTGCLAVQFDADFRPEPTTPTSSSPGQGPLHGARPHGPP